MAVSSTLAIHLPTQIDPTLPSVNTMISLPLKTTVTARWSDHISSALFGVYGSSASDFGKEIEAIDRMRDAVMGASPNSKGGHLLYRYLAQLELLALHIPMRPFKTEFTWRNLYDGDEVTQPSVAFEKVCVLYNLAATLSHLGSESATKEDYKSAYHDFSCAAGILDFSATNFLYTASIDVDSHTLSMLSELMLAQAQHCFYLKAKQSPSSNLGLLAKLASSAAFLYSENLSKLESIYDEEHWGDKQHIKELEKTSKSLKAQAQLLQAQHCETVTHKYGEAIAHLQEAKKLVSDKNELAEINTQLKALERNNDLIFHEKVPSVVPEIKSTQAAKPLPLDAVFPEEEARQIVGKDLFERVIPLAVHEKASMYSEMKAQFLRDQKEKSEIAGLELTSALEFMKLPSAISKLRQPISEIAEVPPEVLEWSVTISSGRKNERPSFDEQRQRLLSLLKSQQTVDSTGAIENIHAIKQSLVTASKSDAELQQMYDQMKDTLIILSNTSKLPQVYRDEANNNNQDKNGPPNISLLDLDSTSSEGTDGAANFEAKLDEIASLVAKLHKIQSERQTTLADLRDKMHRDDATQLIVAHQDTPDIEKSVLQPELNKFEQSVRRIDATVRLQKSVLNDTATKWKALLASSEAKKLTSDKEQAASAVEGLTERFRTCFEQWRAVNEGTDRARRFYADLERRALNLDTPQPPAIPPKPPVPGKVPTKSPGDGLSGYITPSAYNPSMYE